jgi:hypothetical protein
MAINPIIMFAIIAGVLTSIRKYSQSKNIKDSILTFVLWFLTLGTPFHFILVGIYLGKWVNRRVYQSWSNNWGAFLVSLVVTPILFALWFTVLKLVIGIVASGVLDLGGAIVLGVGLAVILVSLMLVGLGLYLISSFYISFKRRAGGITR